MKNLKRYFLLLLPLVYFVYLLYIRIFLTRIPRDLALFSNNITFFITSCIVLGFIIRAYIELKALNIIKTREIKNKILRLWKEKLLTFIKKLEKLVWNFFAYLSNKSTKYNRILFKLIEYSFLFLPSKWYTVIIIFIDVISKLVVVLLFLIDVFYFKQLNYFYKSLGLLLLPLLLNMLTIALLQYYKKNIVYYISYMDSKPIEGTEYYELCFKENADTTEFDHDIDFLFYGLFCPLFQLPYNLVQRMNIHDKYKVKWINLIIYLMYIIGWGYILLVGIGLKNISIDVNIFWFLFPYNNIHTIFIILPFISISFQCYKKHTSALFRNLLPKFLLPVVQKYLRLVYLNNLGYIINIIHYVYFVFFCLHLRLLYLQQINTINEIFIKYHLLLFFWIIIRCLDTLIVLLFQNGEQLNFSENELRRLHDRIYFLRILKFFFQILAYMIFIPFYNTYLNSLKTLKF